MYEFIFVLNSKMWPISAALQYTGFQIVSNLGFDLSRSLKIRPKFQTTHTHSCQGEISLNRLVPSTRYIIIFSTRYIIILSTRYIIILERFMWENFLIRWNICITQGMWSFCSNHVSTPWLMNGLFLVTKNKRNGMFWIILSKMLLHLQVILKC